MPDTDSPSLTSDAAKRRRTWRNTALRLVRRVHLYAGLFLAPWVLLYGISGVLFNHSSCGADVVNTPVSSARLAARGVHPADPEDLARRLVDQLNASSAPGGPYRQDDSFASRLHGPALLQAPGSGVNHLVLVDMERGRAMISARSLGRPRVRPPFADTDVSLPDTSPALLSSKLEGLLQDRGMQPIGPLRAHPKITPELRFRMLDGQERTWNVTHRLGTDVVDGRLSDREPDLDTYQKLTRLHTQHHFPSRIGVTWLWALVADLLGSTMVVWVITGLFMWWQVRPRRLLGGGVIVASIGIAAYLMLGTLSEAHFGNVGRIAGPGGSSPPAPKPSGPPEEPSEASQEPSEASQEPSEVSQEPSKAGSQVQHTAPAGGQPLTRTQSLFGPRPNADSNLFGPFVLEARDLTSRAPQGRAIEREPRSRSMEINRSAIPNSTWSRAIQPRRVPQLFTHEALLEGYNGASPFLFSSPNATRLATHREGLVEGTLADGQLASRSRRALGDLTNPQAVVAGALPFDPRAVATLDIVPDPLIALGPRPQPDLRPWRPATSWVRRLEPSPGAYQQAVAECVARIQAGEFDKVVLSRTVELQTAAAFDVPSIVRRLVAQNPAGTCFAVQRRRNNADPSTLVGASPELLVSRAGIRFCAHPLAGSMARSSDPAEDMLLAETLLESAKDRAEHQVVVEAVENAFKPLAAKLIVPTEPTLVATPTLWHLGTRVSGELIDPSTSVLDLVEALHPTPAVCGAPRADAFAALREYEGFDRGLFTGAVGYCDAQGDGEWAVTIRCAEMQSNQVRLFAGAGIVADSRPDRELRETAHKLQTMIRALGITPPSEELS